MKRAARIELDTWAAVKYDKMEMLRKYLGFFLSFCCIVFVASCGIDNAIVYLIELPRLQAHDTKTITFLGPTPSGDANYSGIRIFYKIYGDETKAATERTQFESMQNSTNAYPGAYILTNLAPMTHSGFKYKRLKIGDTFQLGIPKALISLNETITIEFSATSGVEPTLKINSSVNNITRNLGESSLSFLIKPKTSDIDYDDTEEKSTVYIQFFAAAYGYDVSGIFNEIYGNALWLGLITVTY